MARRFLLIGLLFVTLTVLGCQQEAATSKETLSQEVHNQLVATCDGCQSYMALYVDPQNILTARYPSGNKPMYLTVVGEDGQPVKCCNSPMRGIVNEEGKLVLKCPHCGKIKPVAVKDGKVYVE